MEREEYLNDLGNVVQNCDLISRAQSAFEIKKYTDMLEERVKELETRLRLGCNECMNFNYCPVVINGITTSCSWKVRKI